MSQHKDERGAAEKVLDVLDALAGYAVRGVSNTALAQHLNLNASTITRSMEILVKKGWARKDETTGLFHPTPRMAQVFGRVLADIDRAEQQLADIKNRFTRN